MIKVEGKENTAPEDWGKTNLATMETVRHPVIKAHSQ